MSYENKFPLKNNNNIAHFNVCTSYYFTHTNLLFSCYELFFSMHDGNNLFLLDILGAYV